jgi:F-type H+-transporting ATPase subunit delta
MKSQLLLNKYTLGLANALKTESEYETIRGELLDFARLCRDHRELKEILESPILAARKKSEIVGSILAAESFQPKTARFILLLMEHNRLELLDEILDCLPVLWNEKRGVRTFEVSSVVPLTGAQEARLKGELERLEKTQVRLIYKIDPDIIGGLALKKGNLVYDISLKGHLLDLKEKLSEG